jgi:hypothetical protein
MVSFEEAKRQETANIHGNKHENVISSIPENCGTL